MRSTSTCSDEAFALGHGLLLLGRGDPLEVRQGVGLLVAQVLEQGRPDRRDPDVERVAVVGARVVGHRAERRLDAGERRVDLAVLLLHGVQHLVAAVSPSSAACRSRTGQMYSSSTWW